MIRIIREEEPSKPSTRLSTNESLPSLAALRQIEPHRLTALLRGDLDWVIMKCLEKPRNRRYETANALARDVQRYLADEAVEARPPPSAKYRFQKFVRRNKGPMIAAGLVLLALVGGIVGTTYGLFREQKAAAAELVAKLDAEARHIEAEKRKTRTNRANRRPSTPSSIPAMPLPESRAEVQPSTRRPTQDTPQRTARLLSIAPRTTPVRP